MRNGPSHRNKIAIGIALLMVGCTGEFPTLGEFAGRYEDAYPDRQLDRVSRAVDVDKTGAGFKGHFDVSYHSAGSGEAGTDRVNYFGSGDGVTPERRF